MSATDPADSIFERMLPAPFVSERVAMNATRNTLWNWFVDPGRFALWNPDVISQNWSKDATGLVFKRGLTGGTIPYRCKVAHDAQADGWALELSQMRATSWLRHSEYEYSIFPAKMGSLVQIHARFDPRIFPVRRIFGAIMNDWIMRNVFRLKELVENEARS